MDQRRSGLRRVLSPVVFGIVLVAVIPGEGEAYTTTMVTAQRADGPVDVTVYVPDGYDESVPTPLILLLHGYSTTAAEIEFYFRYLLLVDSQEFIYAVPQGRTDLAGEPSWTATDACCNLFDLGGPDDDTLYLRDLIDRIQQILHVDERRIHLAGHSNGGFMAHRMACEYPGLIASIVSLAGGTFADPLDCAPRQPVHILQIHGTLDPVILYGGGAINGVPYPGAVATSEIWSEFNNCDLSFVATITGALDLAVGPDPETDILKYVTKCNIPGSVEHWRMVGQGHGPTFTPNFNVETVGYLLGHPKQEVRFTDSTHVAWDPVPDAKWFNVYRRAASGFVDGDADGLPDDGYGTCQFDADVTDTLFEEASTPSPGEVFYYTVGYADRQFQQRDGGIGVTSTGLQRTDPPICN